MLQNDAALKRIWDGIWEKKWCTLFHSFGFVGSLSGMDLRKKTMSSVRIFQLLCRVAVLHVETVVNSWHFSAHMSLEIFERWPQLQWVAEIPSTDLWYGFESVQRLFTTFLLECLSLTQHHLKAFCSWKWMWYRRKRCLHIFYACVLKCIALREKPLESDCSFPLCWDLPKVWAYTNTPQKCFHLPAAHRVCAASREAIASAVFCCLQKEAGSAMPTSSTCAPSASSECSWIDKVPQRGSWHSTKAPLYVITDPKPLL